MWRWHEAAASQNLKLESFGDQMTSVGLHRRSRGMIGKWQGDPAHSSGSWTQIGKTKSRTEPYLQNQRAITEDRGIMVSGFHMHQ